MRNHPVAALQRGQDELSDVFPTGGKHQQCFRFKVHCFVQQQVSETLSEWRTTGLARGDHGLALCAKKGSDTVDVGGLARAINTF